MVPLALASGGDLPRSPGSSGSKDTTPVVPPGDCPHHTCVARLVLRHYFVGSSPGVCERTPHSPSRLVPQNATNLFRRHCADTRATLGPLEFLHIPSPPACNQNPALAVFQLVPGGLLCSLMDKVELRICPLTALRELSFPDASIHAVCMNMDSADAVPSSIETKGIAGFGRAL